jgi:hypothetical protein
LTTTATLPPTTTTMNYCVEEQGMNAPMTIDSTQVAYKPNPDVTTPPGDINPTVSTPGLTFTNEMNPTINVTLNQPATLTLIYVPTDKPNYPSNVNEFIVIFVFPNGTTSTPQTSTISGSVDTTTTTTTSGLLSQTTTTTVATGTTPAVQPPSGVSPQVDLPPNFQVPADTTVIIIITSTIDHHPPTGVRITLVLVVFLSETRSER